MILSQILSLGIFLANPVRVTERGSGTIHGIVKAYISILETAKSILHKDNQGESSFTFSKQVKAWAHRIHPFYKTFILMVDRDVLGDQIKEFRAISDFKTLHIFKAW